MPNILSAKTRTAHARKNRLSVERRRSMLRSSLYEFAIPTKEGAKNNPTAVECCILSSSEALYLKKGNEILNTTIKVTK